MTPEALNEIVLTVFGARGTKTYTSALGTLDKFPKSIIGAIQGATFTKTPSGFEDIRDGRADTDSKRGKSEWSGYHAEMMIVSAMLGYLKISSGLKLSSIKAKLKEAAGTVVICADAPCCKHCGNVLDALGIKYHGEKGAGGLTGWWNPFTDNVIPNGDPAFHDDLPTVARGSY